MVAQSTFPTNGTKQNESGIYYAYTNATIWVDYQTKMENATLVVKDGKVVSVGVKTPIPAGAVVQNLDGQWIYPSFIETYSNYGMPEVKSSEWNPRPQLESKKEGAFHWNESIHPEVNAADHFTMDSKKAESMMKAGFGATLSHVNDGIVRGSATLVLLGAENENQAIINDKSAAIFSFQKGHSKQTYPSSMMGSIALLKQTYHDLEWYQYNQEDGKINNSFEAMGVLQNLPQFFDTRDPLEAIRADLVGDQFDVQYVFYGSGSEYQRIEELKATKGKFIIPMNFPTAYDVEDPYDAQMVELSDLLHWEYAPSNAKMLADAGIDFAITTKGLESPETLLSNLKKAVERGLDPQVAIKALTYTPASILGEQEEIGALRNGFLANFIIVSDDLFKDGEILKNCINGNEYTVKEHDGRDFSGKYDLSINSKNYAIEIHKGNKAKLILDEENKLDVSLSISRSVVSITFKESEESELYRLSGEIVDNKNWRGKAQDPNGKWTNWTIKRTGDVEEKEEEDKASETVSLGDVRYPFMAYGWTTKPDQENVVYRNATVWTNEAEGILQQADVWIKDGKIAGVGVDLKVEGAKEIDATGKHITSGIIDEHSHIAIHRGVNESGQAVTAEVSISDVVNSEDINIYRQLAGGVTTSQLLHGSANPIGGQSALVKLRWGSSPEEMKIQGTPGFIKFALGENVKQSNWGEYNTVRFPQTRMGVEQVFYDAFINAKEYESQWKAYNALSKNEKKKVSPPRKDLEMETLVEILNSERFVSCHSYIQSEINMLMNVADSMGFTLNTFTHILEGYKVADKMKEHGAGGSTFSDWWAYKYEVNDAIPYNAAILHKMGVLTSLNSDDAEMARRLNQEAAKAVKYGGVSEEEAWKMVTLNSAKLLHLDARMGSLKVDKDADVVIWNENPLSIYAMAQKTYVDGRCYFDIDQDAKLRVEVAKERNRIIQDMIAAKKDGQPTRRASRKHRPHYHCDTVEEAEEHHH